MRTGFIDYVNPTVSPPERSTKLLQDLLGRQVRRQDPARRGGRVMHVGIHAEHLDAGEQRVIAAGLTPFNQGDYEYRLFCETETTPGRRADRNAVAEDGMLKGGWSRRPKGKGGTATAELRDSLFVLFVPAALFTALNFLFA